MVRFPSWLCPAAEDRDRFFDMQSRVRVARIVTMFCSVAVILTLVGRGGWPIPVFAGVMLVIITAAYLNPLVASDLRHRADSTLDALTGLLNIRSLSTRVAEVTEQAAMTGQPVSLVGLDLDHFKAINDEHGHAAGDVALREIADALRNSLRTFELLYRVGGDEFLLLLPGASARDAAQIAESLRRAVLQAKPLGVPVTCCCGVATAFVAADSKALTTNADAALYRAKRNGRNRVELHMPLSSAAAA